MLYGSYGFDLLSLFLLILGSLFNFSKYTSPLGLLIFIVVLFRAFSKNIFKRTNELNKFIDFFNILLRKFNKEIPYNLPRVTFDSFSSSFSILKNNINQKIQYKKQYKILKCPKCKQKLRVPRGKGKITVTCKRCSHEFHAKS